MPIAVLVIIEDELVLLCTIVGRNLSRRIGYRSQREHSQQSLLMGISKLRELH